MASGRINIADLGEPEREAIVALLRSELISADIDQEARSWIERGWNDQEVTGDPQGEAFFEPMVQAAGVLIWRNTGQLYDSNELIQLARTAGLFEEFTANQSAIRTRFIAMKGWAGCLGALPWLALLLVILGVAFWVPTRG